MRQNKTRFLSIVALITINFILVSHKSELIAIPDSGTCDRGTDLTSATAVYNSNCSGSTSTINCTVGLNQFIANPVTLAGIGTFTCNGVNDVFCCAEYGPFENCPDGGLQKRRITKIICRAL